jgi:hypothetical protein
LIHEIRNIIAFDQKAINGRICARALSVIEASQKVEDPVFLETIRKYYVDSKNKDFYEDRDFVYVLTNNTEIPVLVTLLSRDMIDGTVIMKTEKPEMTNVFKAWKFHQKMKTTSRK